jgi:hypothetical protein
MMSLEEVERCWVWKEVPRAARAVSRVLVHIYSEGVHPLVVRCRVTRFDSREVA